MCLSPIYGLLLYVLWPAACLEVGVPERFLRPRNFNPHPYTDVVDPGGPQLDQTVLVPSRLAHFVRDTLPDLPEHPYALFKRPPSRGDDGRAPIQFPKVPESANIPEPRQRLKPASIKHPLNLGGVPQQRLFSTQGLKPDKKYAFSYAVLDKSSGDDFSHSQLGSGGQTKGEYRVKLPDGRVQVVSYTADHRGYRADVRYDEDNSVEPELGGGNYAQQAAPLVYPGQRQPPATLHHRLAHPVQLHLPKPAYKTVLVDYEDTTLKPIRDHTPIHEEDQEDYGDYQANTVSSTPSYGFVRPSLAQPVQVQPVQAGFRDIALGERAGPVKFPSNPPPREEQGPSNRFVASSPSPSYAESSPSNLPPTASQEFYFTTPSPVKLFLAEDGQLYTQK